jgi:hypothetical protein
MSPKLKHWKNKTRDTQQSDGHYCSFRSRQVNVTTNLKLSNSTILEQLILPFSFKTDNWIDSTSQDSGLGLKTTEKTSPRVKSVGIVRRKVDHQNQKPHNCILSCIREKGKMASWNKRIISFKKKVWHLLECHTSQNTKMEITMMNCSEAKCLATLWPRDAMEQMCIFGHN